MPSSIEEVVYDEARRGLDQQRETVDALRTRAGIVLAAASLITTFLGGQALGDDAPICGSAVVAIVAFLLLVASLLVVLLPWQFEFSMKPADLIRDYVDVTDKPELEVVLRDLALHYKTSHTNNGPKMQALIWSFRIAVVLLAVEVTAWLIAL